MNKNPHSILGPLFAAQVATVISAAIATTTTALLLLWISDAGAYENYQFDRSRATAPTPGLSRVSNHTEERKALARCLQLSSNVASATGETPTAYQLQNLGHCLVRSGETEKGLMALEAAARLSPDDRQLRKGLGHLQFIAQAYDSAIETLTANHQENPEDYSTLIMLGIAYQQTNRHADALNYLNLAVQQHPEHAVSHIRLAWSLEGLGDYVQACHWFRSAQTTATRQDDRVSLERAESGIQRSCAQITNERSQSQPTGIADTGN